MKWLPALLVVVACGKNAASPAPEEPTRSDSPKTAWAPDQPVDLATLELQPMFVVVEQTSVCPTREQARARDCGNSVESTDKGRLHARGSAITVVGDAAIDGQWRAIRFQKAGTLPGWVRADDISDEPNVEALDRFAERADVETARPAELLSLAEIAELPEGILLSWHRHRGLELGVPGSPDAVLYVPVADGVVAVGVREPAAAPAFMIHHDCLVYGDCLALSYFCVADGYCDEVSILARTSGRMVEPPSDPGWPADWTGQMPLLQAVVVADRFGTFESAVRR